MYQIPENILLIDKPVGITSFDVVQKIRRKLNIKKVGHAGTLDPLASGLLVLGVGPGTKLLKQYVGESKVYEAEICIGENTTTGDREGEIISTKKVGDINETILTETLNTLVGIHRLPVSAYSAVKQGGEALYKKARRGEKVTIPIRDMEILEATYISKRKNRDKLYIQALFSVGSGTYIRSLAEEYGKRLGYPARLENLRRTQVGDFHIRHANAI